MKNFDLNLPGISFPMICVKGTNYLFGSPHEKVEVNVGDFFISKFPVTQALWEYIMGGNPAFFKGEHRPVEHVSFNDVVNEGGFLDKINEKLKDRLPVGHKFRLPSETEWEYAAKGGIYWKDDFLFSGSNDVLEVAWQSEIKSGTETHPVGEKKPNQLGIHDMCGNVWEWCEDYFQRDIHLIPKNGSPCFLESDARVLRGGCHHNGAIHCTVFKRYEIFPDAKDECIGFRLVVSI